MQEVRPVYVAKSVYTHFRPSLIDTLQAVKRRSSRAGPSLRTARSYTTLD